MNKAGTILIWVWIKDIVVEKLSHVWLFGTPWIVACQAPLSMGFSSKYTGAGWHLLLQGIFLIEESDLHCRWILYHSHQGSPKLQKRKWIIKIQCVINVYFSKVPLSYWWTPACLTWSTRCPDSMQLPCSARAVNSAWMAEVSCGRL